MTDDAKLVVKALCKLNAGKGGSHRIIRFKSKSVPFEGMVCVTCFRSPQLHDSSEVLLARLREAQR